MEMLLKIYFSKRISLETSDFRGVQIGRRGWWSRAKKVKAGFWKVIQSRWNEF